MGRDSYFSQQRRHFRSEPHETMPTTPSGTISSIPICMACICSPKRCCATCRIRPAVGVINISSVLGKFGVPGYTAYCTTKHGMIGFGRALALEVVSRGITVNTICPGWVDTEMATQGINETAKSLGITAGRIQSTSGRRGADPTVLGSRGDRRTGRLCRLGRRSRHHRTGDEYLRRSDHGVEFSDDRSIHQTPCELQQETQESRQLKDFYPAL